MFPSPYHYFIFGVFELLFSYSGNTQHFVVNCGHPGVLGTLELTHNCVWVPVTWPPSVPCSLQAASTQYSTVTHIEL
jgi:hypothetical protein